MKQDHDLVIRGGEILDGRGGAPFAGDVAVKDGKIVGVGVVKGYGVEEIDAVGKIVTPGFVDIHTHYDGQVTWSNELTPSTLHGVTTVVSGNCSVGFAPVHAADHDQLIDLMEGVEDIPGAAMHEGLKWNWSTFPEYLDAIDGIPHDIDVAVQVPHTALRLYVMGERALRYEDATEQDIAQMHAIVKQAVQAGALGFSTSRTHNHTSAQGMVVNSLNVAEKELLGIARALQSAGRGVFELVSDWEDERSDDFAMFSRIVRQTGVPLSFSLSQHHHIPDWWRELLRMTEEARAAGLPMTGQTAVRPIGLLGSIEANSHAFVYYPSYRQIANEPMEKKLAVMRDPAFKRRLLSEKTALTGHGLEATRAKYLDRFDEMYLMGDSPDYEPTPESSVEAIARRTGLSPIEIIYDHVMSDDGRGLIYHPMINYASRNLDVCREQLASNCTVPGIGDGGAHVGLICDASNTTYMLTHWGRDRAHGRFDLPWLIRRHTLDTARTVGLNDRGVLLPGLKADLNVIDFSNLKLHKPRMVHDLPAGGRRLLQDATGYDATIVSGTVVRREGRSTGMLPGKLVRNAQKVVLN